MPFACDRRLSNPSIVDEFLDPLSGVYIFFFLPQIGERENIDPFEHIIGDTCGALNLI